MSPREWLPAGTVSCPCSLSGLLEATGEVTADGKRQRQPCSATIHLILAWNRLQVCCGSRVNSSWRQLSRSRANYRLRGLRDKASMHRARRRRMPRGSVAPTRLSPSLQPQPPLLALVVAPWPPIPPALVAPITPPLPEVVPPALTVVDMPPAPPTLVPNLPDPPYVPVPLAGPFDVVFDAAAAQGYFACCHQLAKSGTYVSSCISTQTSLPSGLSAGGTPRPGHAPHSAHAGSPCRFWSTSG